MAYDEDLADRIREPGLVHQHDLDRLAAELDAEPLAGEGALRLPQSGDWQDARDWLASLGK